MPIFSNEVEPVYANRISETPSDAATASQTARGMSPSRFNAAESAAGFLGLGAVDLVDTVQASIPGLSSLTGLQRGDINEAALAKLDMPGAYSFYHQNKGGIEASSGVMGIIASVVATNKATKVAAPFLAGMSRLPYVRRVAALDKQLANSLAATRAVDKSLAARGALGSEQFYGKALVNVRGYSDDIAKGFVTSPKLLARNEARRKSLTLGAAVQTRDALLAEGMMALTLNQNGFLYEDDMATNLAWMGLGVGASAGAGWLGANHILKKFTNQDKVRRAFAGAMDPQDVERGRNMWSRSGAQPAEGFSVYLSGKDFDEAVSLGVEARRLNNLPLEGQGAANLRESRAKLATQKEAQMLEKLRKPISRGITSQGLSRFTTDTEGAWNHLKQITKADPGAFWGAEMVGVIPEGMTTRELVDGHFDRIAERFEENAKLLKTKKSANGKPLAEEELDRLRLQQKQLQYESELTPVPFIDGEAATMAEVKALDGYTPPHINDIRFEKDPTIGLRLGKKGERKPNEDGMFSVKRPSGRGVISVDTKLDIHLPGKKHINDADHFDMLRLYRVADDAVEHMAKFEGPIRVPDNPTWLQLDMAEEIVKRSKGAADVRYPAGMNRESAIVESLAQKSAAIQKEQLKFDSQNIGKVAEGLDPEAKLHQLRVKYNLPRLTAYERGVTGQTEHPLMQVLRGAADYDVNELRRMSLDDVKQLTADTKAINDVVPVTKDDIESVHGNSFKYMRDHDGNATVPLLTLKRPWKKEDWSMGAIEDRLAQNKMLVAKNLSEAKGPMTRSLTEDIMQSSDLAEASKTSELMDIQIQGGFLGSDHTGLPGAIGKAFQTSEFRDRDNPIMLAASRLYDSVSRQTKSYMEKMVRGTFGDSLSKLKSPANATSDMLLNQFHSFAQGWDLAAKPVVRQGPNGKQLYAFELRDTAANRARWANTHGPGMPRGQLLVGPDGVEVVLDDLALEMQTKFNLLSDVELTEKNSLLRAIGMPEIRRGEVYIPPASSKGKIIGFVQGPDGEVLPGFTVMARTRAEYVKRKEEILGRMKTLSPGFTFRSLDEIKEFSTIWDKVQADLIDSGTTAIQPGKQNRGALQGTVLNMNAFNESLEYVQNSLLAHGNDVYERLVKEQIDAARARSAIANPPRKNAKGKPEQQHRNIHDMYLENLTGLSKIDSNKSWLRPVNDFFEDKLDQLFEAGAPQAGRLTAALDAWFDKPLSQITDRTSSKRFQRFADELGKYMPIESVDNMLREKALARTPWKTKEIVANMNSFTAAMMLRIGEVAHPIMNLSGLVNAMPAVIRNFQPRTGESAEAFAKRVGHSANIVTLGDGKQIGYIDMGKVAGRAFKRAWSKESHPDYDYMMSSGYITQEVAELNRQFGAIESKSDVHAFFMGDASKTGFKEKGVLGWSSILSDKSEDFSRTWGHMVGLELADSLGIQGIKNRNVFAHDIANKMIANYNPANRPEIFQGVLGAPLGLFQSFSLNYYQRLFRYAETGDGAAFGAQMAVQAGLFGIPSLTGWQQFQDVIMAASGGETDPESGIWGNLGPLGDIIGAGTVGNIPTLFGAEGFDIVNRADTNVRVPGFQGLPAFTVISKIATGISDSIGIFAESMAKEGVNLSTVQLAEIWSNSIVNRPMAGIIEQFAAGGNDTDSYGQLVHDTVNSMEMAYRMIGLRSMRQSLEVNAFYTNKQAQEHKANADEMLRLRTRSSMRAGTFEDDADAIFTQYIENGGDSKNFYRWIRSTQEAATTSQAQRQLKEVMENPAKLSQTKRLIDAGVSISEDELLTKAEIEGYMTVDETDEINQPDSEPGVYMNQLTIP